MAEYIAIPEEIWQRLETRGMNKVLFRIDGEQHVLIDKENIRNLDIKLEEKETLFDGLYGEWIEDLRRGRVSLRNTGYEGIFIADLPRSLMKKAGSKNRREPVPPKFASGKDKKPKPEPLEEKYVIFCGTKNLKTLSKNAEKTIEKLNQKVEELQRELTSALKSLNDRRRALESIKNGETLDENLREEFRKLRTHPDIEAISVDINKKRIVIRTNPIYINYKKKDYLIGKFKLTIYANGENGGVMMENQTQLIRNKENAYMHHPHIKAKTKTSAPFVCLGNIKETIALLLGERQYPALTAICIEYLKSYNDDDDLAEPPTSWEEKKRC